MANATSALPRLRDDLVVSRLHTAHGDSVVVKDPISGNFFRLGEVEYFIAQQLDGRTSLDEVRRRTEARCGTPLAEETLQAFIRHLEQAHLFAAGTPPRHKRIRGSLLYLRFPLVDPERLLNRLVRPTRLFFTPQFVALSGAVILLAAMTLIGSWSAFAQDLRELYHPSSIPLFMVVVFFLVVAHEFGHALTCRHFGGAVREMGFMLIYFQPALYANVSDAWLFPDKRQRLWVGFAGPYFELFLWAVAVMAWRLTSEETWINHVALIAATGSGIKTLFNFNPLIKLDGYYLLSDYLGIPNLRKKAFRYVGEWIKAIFGTIDAPSEAASAPQRRVYLTYGILATVYSFSLLAFIGAEWGSVLIERSQPVLLALVLGLVGTRFQHRLRGLAGKPGGDDESTESPAAAKPVGDAAARAARRAVRTRRQRTRRAAWLVAAAALLVGMVIGRLQLRVAGPVTVLPEENADVRAAVAGIVEEVYVDEGDAVKVGDRIARLSADAVVAELRTTEAAIQEARANLQRLAAGPRAAEIELAGATVSKAADRLEFARSRLAMFRQLFDRGAATRPEFEQAEELATTAANELAEARGHLKVLAAGARPEEITAMRARLAQLEARETHLVDQVAKLDVVSPVDGIVATPSRQLRSVRRQLVGQGALIAKVYDFRTVTAQIRIPEKEIADIGVGQAVELRARAHPNRAFRGTVTAIATAAEGLPAPDPDAGSLAGQVGGGRTFIVTTRIDNESLLLKPGMTGQAKVFCGERRIIALIGRRLARTFKVEVWSWW